MAADGYDTPFGKLGEDAWAGYVQHWAETVGLSRGESVFEVGCGAGAFLYELYRRGFDVAGIDLAPALIEAARKVMPEGRFNVGEASELSTEPPADLVLSCGVFIYFPSLEYARAALARMIDKARRAVIVLDLPDLALRERAVADRIAAAGGPEAYRARYEGLEHTYFDRGWFAEEMRKLGLVEVRTVDQDIPGYRNGAFRFNAWGYKPSAG
jgi:trans-aconitate methyltransferase